MKNSMMKYLPLKGNDQATHLKVELFYHLGGMNAFTYKNIDRGYYVSATPVKKERNMESFVAFTGCQALVVPAQRQGKKKWEEAVEIFNDNTALTVLINHVLAKNGLELEG